MTVIEKLHFLEEKAHSFDLPLIAQTAREAIEELERLKDYEWMYRALCE